MKLIKIFLNKKDLFMLSLLALMAVFIWLRDTSWMTQSDDTLPILVVIPLIIWLGSPWEFKKVEEKSSQKFIFIVVALIVVGVIFNLTFFLGLGWTYLLWSWLRGKVVTKSLSSLKKLLLLSLMAFPWITLDAEVIGWWFRLSGAHIAATFFSFVGFDVIQTGTNLQVNGLSIAVEVACAGLNTLQSMFIAGTTVAYILLKDQRCFWWNIPFLFIMAWISNTIRIIGICLAGILVSSEFAMGPFHEIGGWLILLFMFSICWLFFSLQQKSSQGIRN